MSATTDWRAALEPYTVADPRRSALDLATSIVPFLALWVLMYLSLSVSYWLTLALAIPTAGFAVRSFIVFHDCGHGSFMGSKKANELIGTVVGVLVFQCFRAWRHEHAVHHATAGDLDRRGVGDVLTITAAEYRAMSWYARLGYRLFRNPLIMFGLGPILAMVVVPRVTIGDRPRIRNAVLLTDLVLAAMVALLCWGLGWARFLEVQLPITMIAGAAGVWLFYVQHQFEEVYWEDSERWSYVDAALRGCSYLKLPRVLQFFSGNIGLHHVHHLSARIPNYNLQRAHDDNAFFHDVPVLTIGEGLRAVRFKVYDTDRRRMVTFAQAREQPKAARRATATPAPAAAD